MVMVVLVLLVDDIMGMMRFCVLRLSICLIVIVLLNGIWISGVIG